MCAGIAVYQPVINGAGGNLVAIQASRLSTFLHSGHAGAKEADSRCRRVLLGLAVPGHVVFVYAIDLLRAGHTSLTPAFLVAYISAALIQIVILVHVCRYCFILFNS